MAVIPVGGGHPIQDNFFSPVNKSNQEFPGVHMAGMAGRFTGIAVDLFTMCLSGYCGDQQLRVKPGPSQVSSVGEAGESPS